jgi:hypothetical protein
VSNQPNRCPPKSFAIHICFSASPDYLFPIGELER